eukprot:49110_1
MDAIRKQNKLKSQIISQQGEKMDAIRKQNKLKTKINSRLQNELDEQLLFQKVKEDEIVLLKNKINRVSSSLSYTRWEIRQIQQWNMNPFVCKFSINPPNFIFTTVQNMVNGNIQWIASMLFQGRQVKSTGSSRATA